ncbi:uncharacterized protein LOC134241585 [Saccostrea cucullata]|uniref:uncharacterized protein LOC134241585 n=1 Tax=Saccostrea cuccullata TaxID=36930 RepID=UPI002ED5471B
MLKTMEDLSEENIEETKRYLKKYKVIDKYFVETQMYDKAKSCLEKHGILIMTGPPGCGKTNAAIHLMLGLSDQDWTCRKIHALEEFSFIEKDEKSLVFIDDLFHHSLLDYDIESWWDKLEYYFSKQILCSGKNNQQKLNLIITARENVINRVCLFMNRVAPLFQESFRVDFNSLTDDEKLDIFSKQTEFSSREKNISFPIVNEEFRSKIKKAEGPIGFPLCAHLYACKQEYRTRGVKFFSHPIEFLKIQIRDEIESDKSSRTKTLFFVLFLFEWHSTQLQKIGRSAKIHIERESHCRQILNDISKDLIDNFIPLDFTELANVAQRLQGSFFLVETEGNYKFVHDSIHDAVGAYFCETYFTETAMYFPLDIIKDQEYYNLSEASMELLAQRLIYDALCNRLSEVFSCRIFRNKTFVDIFCRELKKKKLITINRFFTLKNESSNVSLPCLFWVSHNSLTYASESLYEVTKENYVNTDYQFYLHLYGECCSRNKNLLTTVNGMLRNNFEEIKKEVFNFRDADKNSILHLLVLSERSDESVSAAVEKLLDDGLNVDSRNGRSITPLMFAVEQTLSRKHVIKTLISHGAKQKLSDSERSTVYHHCLRSDNDDKTCAEYLQLLLPKLEEKKEILSKGDSRGETALNTAAKQMHCSRICSILSLLQYEECIVGTLNEEGFSPIHNVVEHLKGISTFVKLECCIRVIIFLRYGIDPQKLSDKNFRAVDLSKDDVVNRILKNPKDISVMKNSLDDLLKNMEPKHCKLDILPDLNEKLGIEIQSRIEKAVPYLLNVIFEK